MGLSKKIRQQLINSFKTEQGEHIRKITDGLLTLEKNPASTERQAVLDEIFREAHSLKGAARAVGMTTIESLGHGLEDLLLNTKEGNLTCSPELFDLLYQALDAIELVIERVEAGNSTPPAKVLALLARLEEAKTELGPAVDTPVETKTQESQSSQIEMRAGKETHEQESSVKSFDGQAELIRRVSEEIHEQESSSVQEEDLVQSPIASPQSDETIRVSISKLDTLMAQFSELLGAKIRAEQRLAEVQQLQSFAAEWHKEWAALRSHYSRLIRNAHNGSSQNGHSNLATNTQSPNKDIATLVDFATYNQDKLRNFNTHSNTLYRELSNDTLRLSLIIDELQEEIKRVRMLPLVTITPTFGRMVRDLAREQDKQITLTISGDETELDKRVLEQIKDPLIHLLRNAVDHGLETVKERQRAGKPAEGNIRLSANQHGNNVVITVSDDGRGLDLEAIRLSAMHKGLINPTEVEKLSDAETKTLILNSGLSTSKTITDISGRGVGLDVVRQNVEDLHGTLEVDFEPNLGTTFTLTLPLTLASSRGLMVQVGEQSFALPLTTVERMLQIKRSDITHVEGKEAIIYQGKPVALAWLANLLELPQNPSSSDQLMIVIIGVAEKRMGLVVDSLVGEQEIVMKSLGKQLAKVGGIAGATVLGSGQVILVLHTADLMKLATWNSSHTSISTNSSYKKTTQQRKAILVVDDSITTRTLEKNILEAAGYEVRLATDGEKALGMLASDGLPNLIVSDVNMPRLDGFGLTSLVKKDSRYTDIPVILVTSLDSPTDKARGIEAGADAYIIKSSFDQGTLLETIEQLV